MPSTLLLLATLAFGHGGEDHAAPTPTGTATGTAAGTATVPDHAARTVASSARHEAVVTVAPGVGEADVTVLLADWATSAPVSDAALTLALTGPTSAQPALASTAPGAWTGHAALADGAYAGSLVVQAGADADLLAITGLHLGAGAPSSVASSPAIPLAAAGLAAAALAGTLLVGLGAGWLLARGRARQVAAVVLTAGLGLAAHEVSAHGGEDHGDAAAHAPSATLALPMESQFLLGLRTTPVVRAPFAEHVAGFGHLVAAPDGAATLRAPMAGTVRTVAGVLGAEVRAGDVLATLVETPGAADRADVALGTASARTAVAEAKARLALAEADAAAIPALGTAISDRERLALGEAVTTARVALEQAEAAVRGLEGGVHVRAPLSGRIARVEVRPGEQVEAGASLFHVVAPGALRVELSLSEADAVHVVAGAAAEVLTPALPGVTMAGLVLDPGQEADPAIGRVTVTVLVSADPRLRPGMAASGWVAAGPARDALVVPDAAVVESGTGPFAFVKTGPEQFAVRTLRLGGRAGDTWEVAGGLAPGDRVVIAATYPLSSLAGR